MTPGNKCDISGYTSTGDLVRTITIRSSSGCTAKILTLGCRLHDLCTRDGTSVVLSHGTLGDVVGDTAYVNTTIGRVANRLSGGRCGDVQEQQLQLNDNGTHTLHGGVLSWDRTLFGIDAVSNSSVALSMVSVDADNGFASAVKVVVLYAFSAHDTLDVALITENIGRFPTITNMTLHTYFDLTGSNGMAEGSALSYVVHAPLCETYLPMTDTNVPTGAIAKTRGTRYDFTTARPMHEGPVSSFKGYDDFFIAKREKDMQLLVSLSGRGRGQRWGVHVRSNQDGFQMYTPGAFASFAAHASVAIEPSAYVDAPNHAHFPSIRLDVGETRTQRIQYTLFET